jgi:SMI1 / KNR4 family (SUKH-1)
MLKVEKNPPADPNEIAKFTTSIGFSLSAGFIDFYKETDGASFLSDNFYVNIWPVTQLIDLNEGYDVNNYIPEFFLFGSDGGGNAFGIEKKTGAVFEIPFIVMSSEDAIFISGSFNEFLAKLN